MAAKLDVKMSNASLRSALFAHEKLLLRDPEAEDLAPGVATLRGQLKVTERAVEDEKETESGMLYVALADDEQLDKLTKGFSDAEFNACGRRRDTPRYRAVFPKGQTDVTQPRLWEQVEKIDDYKIPWGDLTGGEHPDPVVVEHLPKILAGRDLLEDDLEALDQVVDSRARAEWAEGRARLTAVALWDSDYGELMTRFPGDRARVESFFPSLRARKSEASEGSPAPTDNTP